MKEESVIKGLEGRGGSEKGDEGIGEGRKGRMI